MLYLASFNYRPSKYRLVDINSKEIADVSYSKLKELVEEHKVENLCIRYGKVCGKNVSLDKFPRISDRAVKMYIARKLMIQGKVYKYTCIFGNGKVEECDSDTTFNYINIIGCVNAYTKGEGLIVYDSTYKTKEVGRKEIVYCLEDYEMLFKKYKKLGIGKSSVNHNYMGAQIVFGKVLPEHALKSRLNTFIEGHKYMSIILSNSVIRQYGKIYESYFMSTEDFVLRGKGLVGYVFTYYNSKIGYHSIVVSSQDKKLKNYVSKSAELISDANALDRITKYSKEEMDNKEYETVGQVEDYKLMDESKLRVGTEFKLVEGRFVSEFGNLIIKDTVKIGNSQETLILNKLGK